MQIQFAHMSLFFAILSERRYYGALHISRH
jgi:hypothetical protein